MAFLARSRGYHGVRLQLLPVCGYQTVHPSGRVGPGITVLSGNGTPCEGEVFVTV